MDTKVLVESDVQIGRRILATIRLERIPFRFAAWVYVPELEEWQLWIATDIVDALGPKQAYLRVFRALQKHQIYDDAPTRRIFLTSPSGELARDLERFVDRAPLLSSRRIRVVPTRIDDAYVYSGGSLILSKAGSQGRFQLMYAPRLGDASGAALTREFPRLDSLQRFLATELNIARPEIEAAVSELTESDFATIGDIDVSRSTLRRLGLNGG